MKVNIEGLGAIEASKDAFNTLGIACAEAGEFFELKGMSALSDVYKQYSNSLYNELKQLGYYTRRDR